MTFQLVAQCPNQLHHHVPQYQNTVKIKIGFLHTIHLPDRNTKRFKEIMVEMRAAWISRYN